MVKNNIAATVRVVVKIRRMDYSSYLLRLPQGYPGHYTRASLVSVAMSLPHSEHLPVVLPVRS